MATYYLKVDTRVIKVLLARTSGPFGSPEVAAALGQGVRKWGVRLQTRAVWNVTGHPVVYDGHVFRVMVRTGALRSSIELQWPYQTQFQARVFVNGNVMNDGDPRAPSVKPKSVATYAGAIEFGHKEIDLKKTMKGKIVPFFGTRQAKNRGPFAAAGLKPRDPNDTGYGSAWRSEAHDRKLAARGHGPMTFTKMGGNAAYQGAKQGASTYFISFRRVGDKGWVIPEAKPRPFLRAALEGTKDAGRRDMANAVKGALLKRA